MDWEKFPTFVTKIQLRYNIQDQDQHPYDDQCDGNGRLHKFKLVQVEFNILQVAIIMGRNHILKMLMDHRQNPAKIDHFVEYVSDPCISSSGLARSWISAANAVHLAARFNPEALFIILDKFLNSGEEKKNFWEKTSKSFGFSPLHNAVTRSNAVSTRYATNCQIST